MAGGDVDVNGRGRGLSLMVLAVLGVTAVAASSTLLALHYRAGTAVALPVRSPRAITAPAAPASPAPTVLREPLPPARQLGALAYFPNFAQTVLYGGGAGLTDTWILEGSVWREAHPAHVPRIAEPLAAGEDNRGHLVMVGVPLDGSGATQTWTWDGGDWTRRQDLPLEPGEIPWAMAAENFNGPNSVVLVTLWGAGATRPPAMHTWTWDGDTWTLRHLPQDRLLGTSRPTLGDDSLGKVLAVSSDESGAMQTWAWNGLSWARADGGVSAAIPYDPLTATMAYEPVTNGVLLVMSLDTVANSWLWNGRQWAPLPNAGHPAVSTLYGAGVVFSSVFHHRVELLGGSSGQSRFDRLWDFDGTRWAAG